MQFIGETLWIGKLGHFLVLLSFVASLVTTIAYFSASKKSDIVEKNKWQRLARKVFIVHSVALAGIFICIFYICSNHMFEYMYAYKHASLELEYKYLLACIWEGQEGSFLLWAIWHAALGLAFIINRKASWSDKWEAPVMTVISFAQVFLTMMLIGIYAGDAQLGSSPFTLTRNEIQAPIFAQANYLSFLTDGMGLNVLLRNYWMVIHPPVLFLGFASSIIPFAYAYAGIQTKKFGEWIKPALPWALFCAAILGVGIMMGGKWAYESLSFGGYWAWDPVENASLVPWLILIAGLHTMVIYNSTGQSLRATYLFCFLSFGFVLYSTFLTRTGVLGDTSVHAFTEAGKAINIMIGLFVAAFVLPALTLLIINYKKIPTVHKEEQSNSREFWMFIGSIVFFLSALFIISKTSVPVINKVFGTTIAPPEEVEFSYNKVMVLIAFIVGMLTAIGQYFKYKSSPKGYTLKHIAVPTVIAAILTLVLAFVYPFTYSKYGPGFLGAIYIAAFATLYAVVANAWYLITVSKGKILKGGGSVAHFGFGLMIFGMLVSSANKEVISSSTVNGITLPGSTDPMTKEKDDPRENLTLIKEVPTRMGSYEVTYTNDSLGHESGRKFYHLQFEKKNEEGKSTESFALSPDVYMMKDNNMSSNPDTRSYLSKDVFTYISYAINDKRASEDTSSFTIKELLPGDTSFYSNGMVILEGIVKNPETKKHHYHEDDLALMAKVKVVTKEGQAYNAEPLIEVQNEQPIYKDDTVFAQNLFLRFAGIGEDAKIKIGVKESDRLIDFVTVKTYVFPYINLVWLGLIIMAMGIVLSMLYRGKMGKIGTIVFLSLAFIGLVYMFLLANA